jgi:fumarate reductase flavoprotein subunit
MTSAEDLEADEVDVAVIGGGAAGMTAALRAAGNPGLRVALFEKSTQLGCNTQVSSGSLAAGGTRYQAAAGVVDSARRHAEDILAVSKDEASLPLLTAITEAAPRYVEWLADDLDHPMELGLDMSRSGQSVPRLHTDVGRRGGHVLVQTLRGAIARSDTIAFVDNCPGVGLIGSAAGVTGVEVLENGRRRQVRARAVVLAADGFAANEKLLAEYCIDAVGAFYGGVSSSTGEALTWGIHLGARTRNLGSFLGHGLVVVGHGTRLNPNLPFLGGVLLDASGRRFVNERAQGYSKLGTILRALPEQRAALVWTEAAHEVALNSELMRQSLSAGAFARYADPDELAEDLRLPRRATAESLVDEAGVPLPFPLYGAWVTHGILTTQGGLEVTPRGEVLREDGQVIAGLFAAGGTAAGVSGASSEGYSSGNGLLAAMGLGWIVGNLLAVG